MPRYIDADALIVRLLDYAVVNRGNYWSAGFKNAITVVEMEETADVVKVVRCEDCEHRNGDYCHRFHDGYSAFIHRDDFCNYGERREDAVF